MTQSAGARLTKVLTALVSIVAAVSLGIFFYQSIRNFFKFAEIDFTSYVRASAWFFNGENPYQEVTRRYLYPQFLLLIVYPFTLLQTGSFWKGMSIGLWSLGSMISFFLTLAATWKHSLGLPSLWSALKNNVVGAALLVLMLHPFLQDEFLNGQVNLYVLGAIAAFFFLLEKDYQVLAALFLAMATSIKIAPGLCLLYVFVSRQYRVVPYFLLFLVTLNLAVPYLINPHSLDYYGYFLDQVVPNLAGADAKYGFKSYSLLSTFSYAFSISWYPPVKLAVAGIVTCLLCLPILKYAPVWSSRPSFYHRFVVLAAIITIIPLTFPMSEAHHLLLQTIPYLAILGFWRELYIGGNSLLKDRLSLAFMLLVAGHHLGHGLKNTPIRLICLLGLYFCFLALLRRLRHHDGVFSTSLDPHATTQ